MGMNSTNLFTNLKKHCHTDLAPAEQVESLRIVVDLLPAGNKAILKRFLPFLIQVLPPLSLSAYSECFLIYDIYLGRKKCELENADT